MSDLLQEAQVAKQNGDISLAKQLISQALIQQPSNEAAWMLMSEVVEDVRLRRNCLERVLAINPKNAIASDALSRLNTSPLSPVSRGERDIPIEPPRLEKVPPFTPPFTWEGEQEQFLALGDLTYPDLPGESVTPVPDITPTFDWATESDEPDKTIQKIFDAVSNPELASQPLPTTDLPWLEDGAQAADSAPPPEVPAETEAALLDELIGAEGTLPDEQPLRMEDFTVSAEPQLGLDAFISPEEALESVTPDYRMWDNPKVKLDRMVILSSKSLIFATPKESDVPHILGLFAEGKLMRDLLGEKAGIIKLETIQSLTANPKRSELYIEHKDNGKKLVRHVLSFSSPAVRDEVMEAFQIRLGVGFSRVTHSFSLPDKIVPPVVTILFVAFLVWGLTAGLSMLTGIPAPQLGGLQGIITSLQSFVAAIGVTRLILVGALFIFLTLIWLINNIRQPSNLVVLQR